MFKGTKQRERKELGRGSDAGIRTGGEADGDRAQIPLPGTKNNMHGMLRA